MGKNGVRGQLRSETGSQESFEPEYAAFRKSLLRRPESTQVQRQDLGQHVLLRLHIGHIQLIDSIQKLSYNMSKVAKK
jgi:hypothetical protein